MKKTQNQLNNEINEQMFKEKQARIQREINNILRVEQVALVARLHITANGIVPVITFIDVDPESAENNKKDEIILP